MKVIIPLAGFGTRLRPHTYSRPKPLINVAGKPVLGHVLDNLRGLPIEEYIFIRGYLGEQIEAYVSKNYGDKPAHYFEQEVLNGQSTAVNLARSVIEGPILLLFVDTIFEADLSFLIDTDADAVAFVKEVEDPRRFGVAAVDEDGIVTRFIEKPDNMDNRLAVIGMYYIRDSAALLDAIQTQLDENIQTKGEFYLADAFQIMADRGTRFETVEVDAWLDAGTSDALIETNRLLLNRGRGTSPIAKAEDVVVIPPVYIAESAKVSASVVGPYATIGENVVVENCVIRDSIIDADSTVRNMVLKCSLIGQQAHVNGRAQTINIGDSSQFNA
ncbi:MAG: NTP transferase domain-containing protein [Anaerolineae bacterium]|nr:NTP transferase domain-containing protein [Anaerolineae bacterium]